MRKPTLRALAIAGLLSFAGIAQAAIPASERTVLLNFYNSTGGPSWTNNAGWTGAPGTECGWFGVVCNPGGTAVNTLFLPGNNLAGSLPGNLNGLTNLFEFLVDHNQLTGSIPALTGLTILLDFEVDHNQLTGSIPALTGLTSLSYFHVNNNQLTGSIPALTGLTHLSSFHVNNNQLTGSIPALPIVLEFWANNNQLTGSIPAFSALVGEFIVNNNQLTGQIPALAGQTFLTKFVANANQLTGPIPDLTGLTNLQIFRVENNQLSGVIPPLTGLTKLTNFIVFNNELYGKMPSVPSPSALVASGSLLCFNYLERIPDPAWDFATGTTPWYSSCLPIKRKALVDLYNSTGGPGWTNQTNWNGPAGSECGWFGVTCNLPGDVTGIDLHNNNLTGSLPSNINGLTNLFIFEVSTNQLTGSIPALAGLTNLAYFFVDRNQLTGTIPALNGLTNLVDFFVDANQLTGSIPALTGLTKLAQFRVGGNQLTGNVPSVPVPNALAAGQSTLCPNFLIHTADAAWDVATGNTPWYSICLSAPPPALQGRASRKAHGGAGTFNLPLAP